MNKFNKISQTQYLLDGVDKYCKYDEIKLPQAATLRSAGYDIFSVADFTLEPGETIKLPTGINFRAEGDVFLAIAPRSGLGFKYFTRLANTLGIIDADYHEADNEGHMWVKIRNEGDKVLEVKRGEAICQAILLPFLRTDDDNRKQESRIGGFGSTSK